MIAGSLFLKWFLAEKKSMRDCGLSLCLWGILLLSLHTSAFAGDGDGALGASACVIEDVLHGVTDRITPRDEYDVYVPGARYPNTRRMTQNPRFVGEDTRVSLFGGSDPIRISIEYLRTQEARAPYLIHVRDGKIYKADGTLLDTSDGDAPIRYYGEGIRTYMYVMDSEGHIYILTELEQVTGPRTRSRFHHSSVFAAGNVAAAGEITVRNGEIILIDDESGHYESWEPQNRQIIAEFARRGIQIPASAQRFRRGTGH